MYQRQDGFTVIEVMLFLALSALLLVGALVGVNRSINNTRFNDAVNSTTSYMQREYAAVANGQNARGTGLVCNSTNGTVGPGTSVPGMSGCVVLGRLLTFNVGGTSVNSRYIVGRDTATTGVTDTQAVINASARAVNGQGLDSSFDVPWSIEIDQMTRGSISVNNLAIIKSPVSERILIYSFPGTGVGQLDGTMLRDSGAGNTLNQEVSICFLDGGRTGHIRIGAGQGQDVFRADLTSTAGACS